MAYKKDDMIKQCLEAIEEHDLIFVEEIITFVPFGKTTFYEHKLNESDIIKKALDDSRIKTKSVLRKNWRESKSPVLQIALYKLLATPEEYDRLIQQKIDHTSDGEPIGFSIEIADANSNKAK